MNLHILDHRSAASNNIKRFGNYPFHRFQRNILLYIFGPHLKSFIANNQTGELRLYKYSIKDDIFVDCLPANKIRL